MSNNGKIWSGDIADEIATVLLPKIKEKEAYDSRLYESISETEKPQIPGQYISPDGFLIRVVKEEGKTLWRICKLQSL